ncbi:hypothetical protein KIPE111705_16720 [Kibdelosporangium persicum]|uniref:Uncharacterized protein n=2 Tax=Kibdelosporangium persicum TaxID=2698649 RepID=A0ABX2EYF5_9PSEU|nr:hypothetical protein [Kibdelosporangium persicum]
MRGWTLAVSSGALAIAAHGMAGGATPDTALAVLLTMIVAWAGTAVASRFDGLLSVLTALGMAQGAMHLVLNYAVPSHIGHQAAPVDPMVMLATHAVATVVTASLLAKADAAVSLIGSAMRLLLDLIEPPRFPAVASAIHALPDAPERTDHIRAVLLRRVHARRGPPACS